MNITIIGYGRFGTFIACCLDSIGHRVTLYGRETSRHMDRLMREQKNEFPPLLDSVG